MNHFSRQKGFHAFMGFACMMLITVTTAFAADAPKQEEPAYQTAMNDAVAQFLAILENLNKQSLTEPQRIQKLQEITQAVRWGPELQYSFITATEQMVVKAAVNQSLLEKDLLDYTDSNGRKPFLEAKSKPQGGYVSLNWPSPGGQFPVPSTLLMRPIKFTYPGVYYAITIVDNGFLAYTTDIKTKPVYRLEPFNQPLIPRDASQVGVR